MLIKTFKFLTKEKNINTASFEPYTDENGNESMRLIHDYYENNYGDKSHITFPLSFSALGNKIIGKYIDLMIRKYNIPKSEWANKIKVKVTSATDNKTGENYIIYVCAFSGITYTGGITIDEYMNTEIEESDISDDSLTTKYNVSGNLSIVPPEIYELNPDIHNVKIRLEARDRFSNIIETYIYYFNINDEEETHIFTNNVYLESEYLANKENNPDFQITELTPKVITIPNKGKLFCSIYDIDELKELYHIHPSEDLYYSTRRVSNISPERYDVVTYDNTNYLNLGRIVIRPGNDSTVFTGIVRVYSQDKLFNDDSLPLSDIKVYVRMFNINEDGEREYNPDEQDISVKDTGESNVQSYIITAGDVFSFEINHAYPYIEFSLKDTFNDNINIRPVDTYFYMHKLTNDEMRMTTVEKDVNLYLIQTSKYKINLDIPSLTSNSIEGEMYCYYDSITEPFFKRNITFRRSTQFQETPTALINEELPLYGKIIFKTKDNCFVSKMYTVGYDEIGGSGGITSQEPLVESNANINLYPITSYQIYVQKCYSGNTFIRYIDTNNITREVIIEGRSPSLYELIYGVSRMDVNDINGLYEFNTTNDIISPMPGTPIFINSIDNFNNLDTRYSIDRNDYKQSYKVNGETFTGHFVLDNNCNNVLDNIKYDNEVKNLYLSFNEIPTSGSYTPLINKNVRFFGALCISANNYRNLYNSLKRELNEDSDYPSSPIKCIGISRSEATVPSLNPVDPGLYHTDTYLIYNSLYYFNILMQVQAGGDINALNEVKEYFSMIFNKSYNNATISELIDEYNNLISKEGTYVMIVPYNESFYLAYPHTSGEYIQSSLRFTGDIGGIITYLDVNSKYLKIKNVKNSQIDFGDTTLE